MKFIMLDRDGVINYDSRDYIKEPDEWQPIPGSIEAIAQLTQHGIKVGVATNQSGIARGLYTEEILADIHAKMHRLVSNAGGQIDFVTHCPHMPDHGCDCRKPEPGMLYAIASYFNSLPKDSYYIGDRMSDIEAARACGAAPILITSQMTIPEKALLDGVPTFGSLQEVVSFLLSKEN